MRCNQSMYHRISDNLDPEAIIKRALMPGILKIAYKLPVNGRTKLAARLVGINFAPLRAAVAEQP